MKIRNLQSQIHNSLIPPALRIFLPIHLARMFRELVSRDHEDGLATGQPQGIGPEAYLNGTSQGPIPEDARKDGHIRGPPEADS